MARRPGIWKIKLEGDTWYVRFTHDRRRYHLSTGEGEKGPALERAEKLYADVLAGRLTPTRGQATTSTPLVDLLQAWLEALESSYTPGTVGLYETYARAHWLPRWSRLEQLDEAALGAYQRERLAEVTRTTLRKERAALARFGEWLKEQKLLAAPLVFPKLPGRAPGVRATSRKTQATELGEQEVLRLLAELPERSTKPGADGKRFLVRAYFRFLWETALRPATVEALVVGEHWRRGQRHLDVSATIDKARFARRVPLTPTALAILEGVAEPGLPVFGGYDRRAYLKTAARAARLAPEKIRSLSVYDLRHARLTYWVEHGGSLTAVAYLAGHRQVTTTAIYAKATARAAEQLVGQAREAAKQRPAPLVRRAWDSGRDSGRAAKNDERPARGRASILSAILKTCAKGGT
jgi:hypothetical protein